MYYLQYTSSSPQEWPFTYDCQYARNATRAPLTHRLLLVRALNQRLDAFAGFDIVECLLRVSELDLSRLKLLGMLAGVSDRRYT